MLRILTLSLACPLLMMSTGCQDYLARRDTLTLGSGEAVQTNIAQHVIDPWPPRSNSVDPYTDGERLVHGIERYRNPTTGQGQTLLPPVPITPAGVPSAGAATGLR